MSHDSYLTLIIYTQKIDLLFDMSNDYILFKFFPSFFFSHFLAETNISPLSILSKLPLCIAALHTFESYPYKPLPYTTPSDLVKQPLGQ